MIGAPLEIVEAMDKPAARHHSPRSMRAASALAPLVPVMTLAVMGVSSLVMIASFTTTAAPSDAISSAMARWSAA